jgi:putative glutamine amidotransferase
MILIRVFTHMASLFFLVCFPLFSVLAQPQQALVVLSKSYGNGTYEGWLLRKQPDLKLISLFHVRPDSVGYWLHLADGILMTGGEDIFPGRYGKAADTILCGDIDLRRDSLEFRMLDSARVRQIPTFGICRGLQLMNVFGGGSLYLDLPSQLGSGNLHRTDKPVNHEVKVLKDSWLRRTAGVEKGSVLSNHHQGIQKLASGLLAQAHSEDGLTEAFYRPSGSFWAAVQWHPERMPLADPLSDGPAIEFLKQVRSFHQKKK